MDITVENFVYEDGEVVITMGVLPKLKSKIHQLRLLVPFDEPDNYSEIIGFRSIMSEPMTVSQIRQLYRTEVPLLWAMSLHRPMLLVCGKNHCRFFSRMFKEFDFDVTILRGSLLPQNPYPSLEMYWEGTGGSKDEHILMAYKE